MKKITLTVITLLAALTLVACGSDKKKGGTARSGNNIVGGQPGQTCSGCSNSNRLYTAMGRTGSGVDLIMELYAADQAVDTNLANNFAGGYYTGPVDGLGRLYVATGLSCGFGNTGGAIPRGIFDVRVLSHGHMSGSGLISGMQAVAVGGGYEVYMRLKQASFLTVSPQMRGCDGYDYGTEMIGQWEIISVNGHQCGNTILFGGFGANQQGALLCP